MKLKVLLSIVALGVVGAIGHAQLVSTTSCDGTVIERFLCLKMINLRSQIYSLDTQREMLRVNPSYIVALGNGLVRTAEEAMQLMGPDLPEHREGLAKVIHMSNKMVDQAQQGDGNMLVTANMIRTNCATCHGNSNPPGGIGWDEVFRVDWAQINKFCNQPGKNPYLCKSMYAMLSTHAYHHTAKQAKIADFELTRESAQELARILADLKAKGFNHLPEKFRDRAEQAAREVIELASNQNPLAFEKAVGIVNTCKTCHASREDSDIDPWVGNPFKNHM